MTSGILPSALRVALRPLKIVPDDFVCPSCGARRMAETAGLQADEAFPDVPLRQWVISFPFPLRYLFTAHPQAMGKVLGVVYRAIFTHLIHRAGLPLEDGATGAVTLIQRFGNCLERQGLLEQDTESAWLELEPA